MFRTFILTALLAVAGPAWADDRPVGDRVEVNGMTMYY